MTNTDPTAPRRPGGAPALLCVLLTAAATTASGAAPFVCPDGAECREWNDGCNVCSVQETPSGPVDTCTKMLCECYEDDSCVPVCLDNKECVPDAKPAPAPESPPSPFSCPGGATCGEWNDGCNKCGVLDDGAEVCTEMYCMCIEDGSCPPPKCIDVEGCTPIKGDTPGKGGDLEGIDPTMCPMEWKPVCGSDGLVYSNACEAGAQGQDMLYEIASPDNVAVGKKCPAVITEEDDTMCMTEWKPVCGSDGKVHSNACEAGKGGHDVLYEIESPGDVAAGKGCPPDAVSTKEDCGSWSACVDCVEGGCAWTAGWCMKGCMVADMACYTEEDDKTPAEICQAEVLANADSAACNLKSCEECVATALPSDETETCMWFNFGEDMSYCGSACGMAGCGETECPAGAADASKPAPEEDCGSRSACVHCVERGCAWTAGECMKGCMVMDVACYTEEDDKTPAEICQAEVLANADSTACNLKSCEECVAAALPSDETKTCMWFDFGEDMSYCGSACGMAGCGEAECPAGGAAPGEGDEDLIMCTMDWNPVCGSNDKVYSNACMAKADGQEVKYEIESPDDSLTVGKECPPESVSVESVSSSGTDVNTPSPSPSSSGTDVNSASPSPSSSGTDVNSASPSPTSSGASNESVSIESRHSRGSKKGRLRGRR